MVYACKIELIVESESDGVYCLGLNTSPTGEGDALLFAVGENQEDEVAPYDIIIDPGAITTYAGFTVCKLIDRRIHLSFSCRAAYDLGVDSEMVLELGDKVSETQVQVFRDGIRKILQHCKPKNLPLLEI